MVAPNSARRTRETQCPECGHTIKSSAAGRSTRVQCPKCRATIDLIKAEAAPANRSPEPDAPPAALRGAADLAALRGRIEALEARVHALETPGRESPGETQSATTPAAEPQPPEEDLSPVASAKLRWVAPAAEAAPADGFAPEAEAALRHNLSAFPSRTITIGAAAGDAGAQSRAERLKAIFERAQWTVHGPRETAPPGARRGLSLFVGALPASRNASAAYFAFTASGLTLCSMIDPAITGDEAMIFVA